ncbi:ribosomal protein S15, putative [Plasmodium knowlesi strain H]|uniref:Ribosomal protein S15, putative n=3 Tax=Plasmodium knowlesi TaxID=5850 RepID=A0A5K1V6Y3_PLAKH|nr:ribosomal protein S15, apicoplast, putative [Plasmodium knowlesi strain H]OTN65165.1 putative Ribosomal protein S15 [Plasmodium knowlesi]CAA9988087.1 ribosomal protein S15, apicoplast, putative [Plasmodium knowlesi strain H]SBO19950.1 ribosomal protein S15, putative [Plasmodium knowlesi strain H]SBO29091.1 ribosomal protein S15, putative [Plasmodium knowlesi strain H]VVS77561.1 ribosomal protein S15, apicoplast, putative [Plasmodium knowlesi strain H]|eukprot:XP_002259061.1 Ribosomal protein S15, putative [Plasmodium knowlesi strain H]
MKRIRTCLALLLVLHVQLPLGVLFCHGFILDNRVVSSPRGSWRTLRKRKREGSNPSSGVTTDSVYVTWAMSDGHEEMPPSRGHIPNLLEQLSEGDTEQGPSKTNVKTKAQKQKEEMEEIIKKSESIAVERSFSFNRSDIRINPELLKELITQKYRKLFQRHDKDCGSSEIQIIILTFKIFFLTEHMKRNKKDFACLRGLFKCVSKRRRLLVYLGRKNRDIFDKITDFFKIKKPLLPGTAEYYNKDLKYVHFHNTKRFKNNAERKKKVKAKNKKVQTDKILFGD